jgi:adenine deaminase
MKAHGAYASTFSDWWAYKAEVEDAIPYNMALMTDVGLTVAVNSDDPEQARHLNQEAAKSIKYGGLTEEEAFKLCTLNPATMLHVADKVGSIKAGKDADVVLWNANPLSVYATAQKTFVDGIEYYDRQRDSTMRVYIASERNRLIQKMLSAKKEGVKTQPAVITQDQINECEEDRNSSQVYKFTGSKVN